MTRDMYQERAQNFQRSYRAEIDAQRDVDAIATQLAGARLEVRRLPPDILSRVRLNINRR